MNSWQKNQHLRLEKTFGLLFAFGILAILTFMGPDFFYMRPVADDFCFAASLNNGFFPAFAYWFENVQFDFFVLASNLIFVALPIQILPINLASLVTFVVTVSFFAFFLSRLFSAGRIRDSISVSLRNFLYWFFGLIPFFYLQSSFLNIASNFVGNHPEPWSRYFAKITQHTNDVSNSWAFWGVVNSSYLLPFIFSFVYLLSFQINIQSNRRLRLFLSIFIGTAGYVIAATTFLSLVIISCLQKESITEESRSSSIVKILRSISKVKTELFLILSGVIFSYFSPGGISRRLSLQALPVSEKITLGSMVGDISIILAEVFLNIGNLFAIIFGVFIAISLKGDSIEITSKVTRIHHTSRIYLFVCFFMTIASEIFSYRAYWHTFTLRFVFLVFSISFVVLFFRRLSRFMPLAANSVLLAPILIVFSLFGLAQQTNARFEAWNSGKNFGALASVSADSGWVSNCFQDLRNANPGKFYPEFEE
jgi:hypothetical protein